MNTGAATQLRPLHGSMFGYLLPQVILLFCYPFQPSLSNFTVQREECSQPFATKQVSRASNAGPRDGDEVTVCDAQLEFLGEFGRITKNAVFKGRNASLASIAVSA